MFDFNDLTLGIKQAADAMTSYYEIGYYPTHTALDGRFRRIKISLKEGLSADLSYRQGYFADKEFGKFTAADKERQLEDALMLENPVTDINIAMEVNYFQLNSAEYFVPVAVKIPGSELALARRGGASETLIDFIGEVKDDFGNTIQNLRDKLDIKLSDSTASQLATHPIQYETGFTLLPGKYVIKYLARDAETGRIGTYQMSFAIPNLNKEEKRVPISSVVLSSQRVPLGDSIYNVKQKIDAEAANPLVLDGQKLIPSVTRVFSKSRDLYVFLQAYERGRHKHAAHGRLRELLPGAGEGLRDRASGRDPRTGRQIQSRAAPIQPVARQASARPVRLPSDGVGSDRAEGGVLASSHRANPMKDASTLNWSVPPRASACRASLR